jgi:hypothetical protein
MRSLPRPLRRANYRLVLEARDAANNSSTKRTTNFRIVR